MPGIDHTALPFDELLENRMTRGQLPEEGRIVCRIMQDGWEIGTWIESDWEGAGPVAHKILAVNDLLHACRMLKRYGVKGKMPDGRWAYELLAPAIAKAERNGA